MSKILAEYYEIINTQNEWSSKVSAAWETLGEAIYDMRNYSDWYASNGTGRIKKVTITADNRGRIHINKKKQFISNNSPPHPEAIPPASGCFFKTSLINFPGVSPLSRTKQNTKRKESYIMYKKPAFLYHINDALYYISNHPMIFFHTDQTDFCYIFSYLSQNPYGIVTAYIPVKVSYSDSIFDIRCKVRDAWNTYCRNNHLDAEAIQMSEIVPSMDISSAGVVLCHALA